MEQKIDHIAEVSNEDTDNPGEKSDSALPPETNILERSIKILNEKLEKALDKEDSLSKELEESQKEANTLKSKLNEINLNYENKMAKLQKEVTKLRSIAESEELEDLKDSNSQKDRKIRNLNTSVTLLKNFLLFIHNKAVKGLKVSNTDLKKEIEDMKEKYSKELDDSKAQMLQEIEKFASKMPSQTIQDELESSKRNLEKVVQDNKSQLEKLQTEHNTKTEALQKEQDEKIQALIKEHENSIENLKQAHSMEISTLNQENVSKLKSLEEAWTQKLKDSQEQNHKADQFIEALKKDLTTSRSKIEELSKTIGRYESREELGEKSTSEKDREIFSLKDQIKELINTVQNIKNQTKSETDTERADLQSQISELNQKIVAMKAKYSHKIESLQSQHHEEVILLKQKINSSTSVDALQIESMTKLMKEKDSLLESTQKSYQSLINSKTENIESLNQDLGKLKTDLSTAKETIVNKEEENRQLVDRFKEEMQSVLSLKSAHSTEAKLASREELNENMSIINNFCDDPYTHSLKKIFKLKRVRKDDNSVDSTTLMQQNHQSETREHEEVTNQENIHKVREKHVNDGRVEDMAKPGPRPQPLRGARGRPAPRARGMLTNRARPGPTARIPPRHNAPPTNPNRESKPKQNITVMDPSKLKQENAPGPNVDKYIGGITTPPRKRSSIAGDSPKVHRTDPFSLSNQAPKDNQDLRQRLEEENKKQQKDNQNDEGEDEYEIVEEDEESEEETEEEANEELKKEAPKQEAPKQEASKQEALRPSPVKRTAPPPRPAERAGRSKVTAQPPIQRDAALSKKGPPPAQQRKVPGPAPPKRAPPVEPKNAHALPEGKPPMRGPRDTKPSESKRNMPPMKPRNDMAPPKQGPKKKEIDDRSKTPQPSTNTSNTLKPGRVSRFSREAEEPSITHAIVRDKSIGERIVGRFLPGFLGGNTSTVAVSGIDENELKKQEEQKKKEKKEKKKAAKNNESSGFGGMLNNLLGKLTSQKNKTRAPLVFTSESEEDIPPPPTTTKLQAKDPNDKTGKKRLANRYATTFDIGQLAPTDESIGMPTMEPDDDFRPPPIGGSFIPPSDPVIEEPAQSSSPKNINKSPAQRKDPEQKKSPAQKKEESKHENLAQKSETRKSNQEIEDDYVRIEESEIEEVNVAVPSESHTNTALPQQQMSHEEVVGSEIYEKAYNQLQAYKRDCKALKKQIVQIQRKSEMDIDYFVQMVEDVKYRGLEEIETYKSQINILKGEQKSFISKHAENLCLVNRLETELKITRKKLQEKEVFAKPFSSPAEAREKLWQGLGELQSLKNVCETVKNFRSQVILKESQIKNILSEILSNVDQNSEQGQILLQSMEGDYDIDTIRVAIQKIFEDSAKMMSKSSHEIQENYISQIQRITEDSRYKEQRIKELLQEGISRSKMEEEQTKEFMMMAKSNEEKDDQIQELENEVANLKENHKKIEEQYQARFQEILDENQKDREEWMKSGSSTVEETSNLGIELQEQKRVNDALQDELDKLNDSYKIMEAEFSKFDEENNAYKNTIIVLEKEVSRRNDILEQYEQDNNEIIDENQEKVKKLIDENIQLDQKLTEKSMQLSSVCEYLKEIYQTMKGEEITLLEDDIDRSFEGMAPTLTEEEAEQLYEDILKLYQSKQNEIDTQASDLKLKIQEMEIELSYKESELLDSQISESQSSMRTQEDDDKRKSLRLMKEKLDELNADLRNKNNQIKQLSEDLQSRIDQIDSLEIQKDDLEAKLADFDDQEDIETILAENREIQAERDDLHTKLLEANSKLED